MAIENLLNESNLKYNAVDFGSFKEEDYLPAVKQAIAKGKAEIEELKNNSESPSFENTIEKLESCGIEVDRVLTVFYNLYSAEASENLQTLAPQISGLTANFSSDINLDADLFERVKAVYDQRESLSLSEEQKTLLRKTYIGFVRNGALLDQEKKEKLREIDARLAEVSPKFSENILKQTNAFELEITDESKLAGLPDSFIEGARELALEKGLKKKAWIVNLDAPSFVPFLKYSEIRDLRKEVWKAYQSRCAGGEFSNIDIVKEIVSLRHQRAKILGYENHAEYVLEERMAKKPENVIAFLDKLKSPSKAAAEKDLEELKKFAKDQGLEGELMPWDFSFYSEKLKIAQYDFDSEQLKPYLPVEKCIAGAFGLAEKLFEIRFEKNTELPTYHPDVQCYEVFDKKDDSFVGLFYADFFPRATKRAGAWMTSYKSQGYYSGKQQRPHVSIVCNFTKPTKGKPSLLTFMELETLFHEFGHSLHGLLSKCRYKSLGGTNVHWDFVELPSQFMENWLLEKAVLDEFAVHYETGEKIPQELIEKLQKSSHFQAGYQSLRQLNFAYLDMAWHGKYLDDIDDVVAFEREATKDTSLFEPIEGTLSSTGFAHIFAGGYSAGYYSYKWAEVLDADAFEHFKENNLFDQSVARSYKENILEKGGSEEPDTLYRRFRGKDPDPNALLRRDGLL